MKRCKCGRSEALIASMARCGSPSLQRASAAMPIPLVDSAIWRTASKSPLKTTSRGAGSGASTTEAFGGSRRRSISAGKSFSRTFFSNTSGESTVITPGYSAMAMSFTPMALPVARCLHAGAPHRKLNVRRFNSYVIALQAAQAGQGVALGWMVFIFIMGVIAKVGCALTIILTLAVLGIISLF